MKKSLLILFALLPTFLYAGVIMKQSGERLEDVTIKSVTNTEIVYVLNGTETTLHKSEVSAILYDDGRYEENTYQNPVYNQTRNDGNEKYVISQDEYGSKTVVKQQVGLTAKEYNVFAYGICAPMVGYISNTKYDDITVEYRVIYKSEMQDSEFQFLGITPFAYVTDATYDSPIIGKANPTFLKLVEPRPLVIDNAKDIKRIEFRLSKEGYKTTVVKPFKDVLMFGGGPLLMISLNQIKPLKDGEKNETNTFQTDNYEPIVNESIQNTSNPVYEKTATTEVVNNEPTYEEPVYETPALEQHNASASSTYYEEPTYEQAVEVAVKEKEEEPVEELQITAVEEPEIIFKADKKYLNFSETGGMQQVRVEASNPWEIYSSPNWVDVQTSGSTLTISCVANTQYSDREEDLILRDKQGQEILIVIAQDKISDFLNLSANMVNEDEGDGGRYIIHVQTNKQYTVYNAPEWCHVNAFKDSLIMSIEENRSGLERQCEIEIVISERMKKTISVRQSPLQHYVLVNPQIVTATKRGGTISIHVESDDKWRVVNLPEWCQISEQTDDSFRLDIAPNNTDASRTAVFSVSAYGTRKSVTVKQE